MALKSLNQLRAFRNSLIAVRNFWLRRKIGLSIGQNVSISLSARFRPSHPGDITIGADTLVAFKTLFITMDGATGRSAPIKVGSRCFIGGGSLILPGVTIGDECIVGGGSVVFDDVPPRSIVVGNPARVLRSNIEVGVFGRLSSADENERVMYQI